MCYFCIHFFTNNMCSTVEHALNGFTRYFIACHSNNYLCITRSVHIQIHHCGRNVHIKYNNRVYSIYVYMYMYYVYVYIHMYIIYSYTQARAIAWPSGHHFSCPLCIFLYSLFSHSSSVCIAHIILAVPIHKCLGKQVCTRSTFPLAILNGTCSFRSAKTLIRS